ncbi:hypothetical protein F5Y13DRAFT_155242 [Hypoxylon sp. FL1857]|nr:hypothetical protein F5Y13DRAFT_155242 [Hypoxylon sp. FL1857]
MKNCRAAVDGDCWRAYAVHESYTAAALLVCFIYAHQQHLLMLFPRFVTVWRLRVRLGRRFGPSSGAALTSPTFLHRTLFLFSLFAPTIALPCRLVLRRTSQTPCQVSCFRNNVQFEGFHVCNGTPDR